MAVQDKWPTTAKSFELEIAARALDHDCPTCGAKARVRCRFLTKTGGGNPGYPVRTKVDVRPNPCPERSTLGWREMLHSEA